MHVNETDVVSNAEGHLGSACVPADDVVSLTPLRERERCRVPGQTTVIVTLCRCREADRGVVVIVVIHRGVRGVVWTSASSSRDSYDGEFGSDSHTLMIHHNPPAVRYCQERDCRV